MAYALAFIIFVFLLYGFSFHMEEGESFLSAKDPVRTHETNLGVGQDKKVIAVYFPQFHEFEENNQFWGKGFTDFSNVAKIHQNQYGQPVIRPAERMGFYDLMSPGQRRFQGELAKKYNIHGFAIYHYWFGTKAIMEKPLEMMLSDGYPDIPFCLTWANEPWSRRWDGMDGSEVLLNQTYDRETWKPHFDWLLPFLGHTNYLKYRGLPIIIIYRADDIPDLKQMISQWKIWAREANLMGLHVIQINGVGWNGPSSWELQPGVDSLVEFFPNYMMASGFTMNYLVNTQKKADNHFYGVSAAFDNSPRHPGPNGSATVFPFHPSHLYFWLRQNLARTEPGGFVFLNAWNEWGEGAAIEPSIEWGRRWLEAVQTAVSDEQRGHVSKTMPDGYVSSVPLEENSGMPVSYQARQDRVCIIVRTYKGHRTGIYNIHQTLNTLLALNHENWRAFIINTDVTPFEDLHSIVDQYEHKGRIEISPLTATRSFTEDANSPYNVTDRAIQHHCSSSEDFKWLLVTNGDNWYTPDALDFLPNDVDLVLMNFYSRYSILNAISTTNTPDDQACCVRLQNYQCMVADTKVGSIDLGAVIFRYQKYRKEDISFSTFNEQSDARCGVNTGGCHDGILIEYLIENKWSYRGHPVDVCTMHHNSNPKSCELLGGTWFDTMNRNAIGCYYGNILPVPLESVNYQAYLAAQAACVC